MQTCIVVLVGGGSQAESQFAAVKRLLRKQNLLGRASPKDIDWSVLAAQRLRKHPGTVTVMQALAVYRQAREHAPGHSPEEFLNNEKDSAWLLATPPCARHHSHSAFLPNFLDFWTCCQTRPDIIQRVHARVYVTEDR